MSPKRILFVCMGNICRSPTAEGVMRRMVREAGLEDWIAVDSAGTHGYHVGSAPDPRALASARRRGYDLSTLRARELSREDFDAFDLVLGMDFNNLERMQALCPSHLQSRLGLLMPYAQRRRALIIHDPYYRSSGEFEQVLDYIEDACEGLLRALTASAASGSMADDTEERLAPPLGRMLKTASTPMRNAAGSGIR